MDNSIYAEMLAGDIAIFSCFTPHAAAADKSSQPRRMIFLNYNNSQDRDTIQLITLTFVGIERDKCHHPSEANIILSDFMHNSIKQKTETTPLAC